MDAKDQVIPPFIISLCFTTIFWFFLTSFAYPQEPHTPAHTDSIFNTSTFGMRVRELPKDVKNIYEPVLVREAPGNEATIIKLTAGELKIFYINRPGKANQMMSITSHDNGLSWGTPEKEFELPGEAYYANQVLQDEKGDLHCVFHIFAKGKNGYRGRHLDLWYSHKIKGKRWTEPKKIFDGYVGSIRGFIQLKNCRLLLAFAKAVPDRSEKPLANEPDYGWNDIMSLFSDDYGKTWQRSTNSIQVTVKSSNVTRYGGVEPAIIELKNGSVWMLIRTNKGRLYQSYSTNAGSSWSLPSPTNFISSDSPATIVRLSDNRLLMLWCGNQRYDNERSYANGGRKVLHAVVSHDEGKTWKGFREVLTGSSRSYTKGDRGTAYPSAIETNEGKIVAVSGQGKESAILMFDPDWLEENHADDNFKDLSKWTLFGLDSCTGLSLLPTGSRRQALFISRAKGNSSAEAVWNFPSSPKGKIEMKVLVVPGTTGINIALNDHFSVSFDSLASSQSIVNTMLETDTINANGLEMKIGIQWDSRKQKALIYFDKRNNQVINFKRNPLYGLNYLRLGVSGVETCKQGCYLKSITYFAQ